VIRGLLLGVSVFEAMKKTMEGLWEHSVGCALAARIIASDIRVVNPEEAFLGGLLHDIGKLIMLNYDPDKFQLVIEQFYNEGIWFEDAEKTVFPYTHAELGGCVLEKWNFPEVLVKAVTQHHTFTCSDTEDPYQQTMIAVTCLANLFCIKLGIGEREPRTEIYLGDTMASRQLKLDNDRLTFLLEKFAEIYERDKSYFS